MDALRQWAICVIIAAAVGTLACVLSPKGATDKAVRIVVGIFVVATVCVPLAELDFDAVSIPVYAESFESERVNSGTEDYLLSVFVSAVEEEIMLSASQYGADIHSVVIDASLNNECIIISDIHIYIHDIDKEKQAGFSEHIEERLGVPVTLTVK